MKAKYFGVVEKALLVLSVVRITEQGGLFGAQKALYDPTTDHVVLLNATSIKPTIYGTSNAWIVEFFSSWCGHCIHFAPIYKEFAAEVESWASVAKIAAIDCADETNMETCREFEIMGYPTMLFFPPKSKENKVGEDGKPELYRGEAFQKSDKVSDLKYGLMEKVVPHFPSILGEVTSTINTPSGVWKFIRSSHEAGFTTPTLALVMYESEKSNIGKELALRLSSFPEIRVLRFQKRNSLYDKLGFKDEWPAVGYVQEDLQTGIVQIPKNKDIIGFLQSTALKMIHRTDNAANSASLKPEQPNAQIGVAEEPDKAGEGEGKEENNLEEPVSGTSQDTVSLEDLIHAVRNTLRNEVAMHKVISGTKLQVLKDYVHLLGQLFPADRRELVVFFMKFDHWLMTKGTEIQINEYLDKLTELEVELHPWDIDVGTWGTCKGTVPGRRGYTCGLWRLFHTLTMIAAQKSQEVFAFPVIHGYVKEFFGCTECVKHFTTMVQEEAALSIATTRAQALWLWKAHNKVNKRLKGAASEDPGYPKQQYPTETQCSSCHVAEATFDEEKVFEYLTNVYTNPIRTMQGSASKNSQQSYDDSDSKTHDRQSRSTRFFSGTDYWIFCIVYLSVAALLIFGYIHFKLGSRRRVDPLALCRKFIHTSKSIV